jgi:fermentation-respiration switch protein FrsA (DUF1100 family)
MLWKLVYLAAAVYGGLCLSLFFFQSRLVYFPARSLIATPDRIGLAYEDVWLTAADGVRIHGWFVPHAEARGTLLFFHGNAGNIGDRLDSLSIFHHLGLNSLIIDYHGFGNSEGAPGEAETYLDAEAAWGFLLEERGIPAAKIVIFGRSLGGGVAAWLAARVKPAGLIIESTFTSVTDLGAQLYPLFPVRWLARIRYDNKTALASIACPLLVVHSRDDEIMPPAHGRALYDAAPEPKSFLELRGTHNDGFLVSGDAYVNGLSGFFDRILPAGGG